MSDKDDFGTGECCGNCKYAITNPADLKTIECYGMPPSVQPIGVAQDMSGRQGLQFDCFSPRLPRKRPACSLFKQRVMVFDALAPRRPEAN